MDSSSAPAPYPTRASLDTQRLGSPSPAGPLSSRVDVDIRVRAATVAPEPAHQAGVVLFHGVHGLLDEARVGGGDAPIAVRVDRDIGRVTILVAAIARGAPDSAIMEGRAEPRVNAGVEANAFFPTMPPRDLGEH